jgi:hypothetical protein
MSKQTVLVRTDLTESEWADFRKLAIDLRSTTSGTAGDALRSYLKAKRAPRKGGDKP